MFLPLLHVCGWLPSCWTEGLRKREAFLLFTKTPRSHWLSGTHQHTVVYFSQRQPLKEKQISVINNVLRVLFCFVSTSAVGEAGLPVRCGVIEL